MDADLVKVLGAMNELVQEHGAEKAGKIMQCLVDIRSVMSKYDEDICVSAIDFVFKHIGR